VNLKTAELSKKFLNYTIQTRLVRIFITRASEES